MHAKHALLWLIVASLVGCATPREMRMQAAAERACQAAGLDENDERWTDCMIELLAAERAAPRGGGRMATTCTMVGGTMICY